MQDAVTDTHNLIWYLQDSPKLTAAVNRYFDACDNGDICIHIPTICLVEIVYLEEKWQIPSDTLESLPLLSRDGKIKLSAVETVW